MKRWGWLAGAVLAVGFACGSRGAEDGQERFFRAYSIGFADLELAETVARTLIGHGGAVILDRGERRLLVHATESEHRRLAEALAATDRRPRNIRLDVEWDEVASERERGIAVGAAGSDGRAAVGFTVRNRETRERAQTRQTLVVADGREAMLRVGEEVPWLEWIEDWGRRVGASEARVQWQEVGAFLAVEATLVGEGPWVRIRLTPELIGRVEGRPYRQRFAQASTELMARAGETVPLAGLAQHGDFYARFLVGRDGRGAQRTLTLSLTPTVLETEPPAGAPAEPERR